MKIYEVIRSDGYSFGLYSNREKGLDKLRDLFQKHDNYFMNNEKKKWIKDTEFVSELGLSQEFYSLIEREVY